jgi:hypothetical protein
MAVFLTVKRVKAEHFSTGNDSLHPPTGKKPFYMLVLFKNL